MLYHHTVVIKEWRKLHETFSAELLFLDVIALQSETKYTLQRDIGEWTVKITRRYAQNAVSHKVLLKY
jgi:hypothetical protein